MFSRTVFALFLASFGGLLSAVYIVNQDRIRNYFVELSGGAYLIETFATLTYALFILAIVSNSSTRRYFLQTLSRFSIFQILKTEGSSEEFEIRRLHVELERAIKEAKTLSSTKIELAPDDVSSMVDRLEVKLQSELKDQFEENVRKKFIVSEIETLYRASLMRLSEQVAVLGSRANTSLLIGIFFSMLGLAALYLTFFFIQ